MACFIHYQWECDSCGVQSDKRDSSGLGLSPALMFPDGWLHFQVPQVGRVSTDHHVCKVCKEQLLAHALNERQNQERAGSQGLSGSIIGEDGEEMVKPQ